MYEITWLSFNSVSKDDLTKGLIISVKDREKPENPYSEIGDLAVDRLLL
jgi:hypothetical protein